MKILGQDHIINATETGIRLDLPVLLIGETGCGKTTIVRELAKKFKKEFIRFNLTGETTVDEFVGKYILKNGETVWEDGILLQAMKRGAYLLVDEINAALPEILFVLQSLLDDDKFVVLSSKNGEVVVPKKGFRFFAAMNPVAEYAGTKELNRSFLSRFPIVLEINFPSMEHEIAIVAQETEADQNIITKMVEVAVKIRNKKEEGEIYHTCSTRDVIQWATLVKGGISEQNAFEYSILNKATDDSDEMAKVYRDVIGSYRDLEVLESEYGVRGVQNLHEKLKGLIHDNEGLKKQFEKKLMESGKMMFEQWASSRISQYATETF